MRFLHSFVLISLILFLLKRLVTVCSHIFTLWAQWEDLRVKRALTSTILEMHRDHRVLSKLLLKGAIRSIKDRPEDDLELYLRVVEKSKQLCESSQSKTDLKPVFPSSDETTLVQKVISHLLDGKE